MNKIKSISLATITLIALISSLLWPVGTKVNMDIAYQDAPYMQAELFVSRDGATFDVDHSQVVDVIDSQTSFNIGRKWSENLIYRIDLSNIQDPYRVSFIDVSMNNQQAFRMYPSDIMNHFVIMNGEWAEADGTLLITPSNNDSFIVSADTFVSDSLSSFSESVSKNALISRAATVILLALIALAIMWNAGKIMAFLEDKDTKYLPIIVILLALAGVWTIAFKTDLGVHPDEYDVVECLKYGMKHFFPPDMRAEEVAGTYSGYGYTKLINGTWYFFIAGKVAALVKALWSTSVWYRVPNVLLFVAMIFMYIRRISKKEWLVFALGISVQAWYIFSYTTADAFDFFLSFLIILQLTDEESMLNKLIVSRFELKALWKYICLGVLFGFVFLGKEIYWAVLLLAFIALLFKLFDTDKDGRKVLWINYLLIIAVFAITVMTRYGFDLAHYGLNKSEVKKEMAIQYTDYDKNPTTPIEDRCPTYHMYEQGYSLPELFEESTNWVSSTCRSFCGLIGDVEMSGSYYKIIGALYIFVLMLFTYYNLGKSSSVRRRIEYICCLGIMVISVIASVLNSYISDSQAQGRYLLPMLFVASYIGYKTPEIFKSKSGKAVIVALEILSVWYFVLQATGRFGV